MPYGSNLDTDAVERVLRGGEPVRDAAVVVRSNPDGGPRALAGYAELLPGTRGFLPAHLITQAKVSLPPALVPDTIHIVDALPRLADGNLDRVRLNGIDAARASREAPPGHERAFPPDTAQTFGEMSLASYPASELAAPISELTSACRARRPVAFDGAGIAKWTAALNILFLTDRLATLEYGAKRLAEAVPGLAFAEGVAAFFAHLPPVDSRHLPFDNDPTKSVQVARRPDCSTVMLVFCDRFYGFGMPLSAAHRWTGLLPVSLIYLRDFHRRHYLKGVSDLARDRDGTVVALRSLIADVGGRRVLCCGYSAGAFAALDYGAELGAEAVLAMSGATNLSPEFNTLLRWHHTAAQISAELPEAGVDMAERYRSPGRPPRTTLVCAEHDWDDRLQAANMKGIPGVEMRQIDGFSGHNSAIELIRRGEFAKLLTEFVRRSGD